MEIVNPDNRWNDLCQSSPDAFFWHTTHWLDFSTIYTGGTSLSFMVTENKQVLAVCPLILKNNEFDLFWSPAFADLTPKKKERVIDYIFTYIDQLAILHGIKRTSMQIYPLSFPNYNYLMKHGYLDVSINTQVIDLTQDLLTIHGAMRKGHDYDIDRGLREMSVFVFDNHNIQRHDFDEYHKLHAKDAGRETRTQETWDIQYEQIRQNRAILIGATHTIPAHSIPFHTNPNQSVPDQTKPIQFVGFSYIFLFKDKAYYGSSCSDPDYPDLPTGHVLTWETIKWLKSHDFKYYELGWQYYGPQIPYCPSDKEISISKFKRGFGGFTIPLFRGEKYYSKDYFLEVNQERVERYAKGNQE